MKSQAILSRQQVREDFRRRGQTIGSWAQSHGFDRATVNQVLTGRNAASRGVGHKIAVMLGLKDGEIVEDSDHEHV